MYQYLHKRPEILMNLTRLGISIVSTEVERRKSQWESPVETSESCENIGKEHRY